MNIIKHIIFVTLLATMAHTAHAQSIDHMKNIVVIGDSLSYDRHSWARVLDRLGWANIDVSGRGGMPITGTAYPEWAFGDTKTLREPDMIIFFLGTNDAAKGIPLSDFADSAKWMIQNLNESGIPYYVVQIPDYPTLSSEYRSALEDVFISEAGINGTMVDLVTNFSPAFYLDDYHPTPDHHLHLARKMAQKIGITPK